MKKMNGIDTLSAHQQLEIMRWYSISKKAVITLASLLVTITFTQWYIVRRYAPSCKPCITPSYADTIGKKYAEKTGLAHNKKTIDVECTRGNVLLKNYTTFIASHTNQSSHHARLTDLRLTSQGFDTQYISPHRSAVQHQLKELSANPAVNAVSLHTIEQKNNNVTSSFSGSWKEIKNI